MLAFQVTTLASSEGKSNIALAVAGTTGSAATHLFHRRRVSLVGKKLFHLTQYYVLMIYVVVHNFVVRQQLYLKRRI